jgi:hypothetical protein
MKQEANAPNRKYFKPDAVEDSESLYKVAKIYRPNDCNSILKYIDNKSEEDINKVEPKALNKTIKQYSVLGVYSPTKVVLLTNAVPSPFNKVCGLKLTTLS